MEARSPCSALIVVLRFTPPGKTLAALRVYFYSSPARRKKNYFAHSSRENLKGCLLLFRFGLCVHLWGMPKERSRMIGLVLDHVVRGGWAYCSKVWGVEGWVFSWTENHCSHLCVSWTNEVRCPVIPRLTDETESEPEKRKTRQGPSPFPKDGAAKQHLVWHCFSWVMIRNDMGWVSFQTGHKLSLQRSTLWVGC